MSKILNLIKIMLKTSYDIGGIIDADTKKLNKKSMKVWLVFIVFAIAIYLSYMIINSLKEIGLPEFFLELYFLLLQILVMFQTILLVISTLYFSKDIENYLYLPISSIKLFITKLCVMISMIFVAELIIALPSILIYGVRTLQDLWFYLLALIIIPLISIFLSSVVSIIMIFVMRIFRFIKNKYIYQNIVVLVMTLIIFMPLANVLNINNNENINNNIYNGQNEYSEEEELEELKSVAKVIKNSNKYFIVTELGVKALTDINYHSIIYVLEIVGLDLLALLLLLTIGKFTYIKDILYNISIFDKKKDKKIRLEKSCKVNGRKCAYLKNEIRQIVKSPTYLMHYIYNVLVILFIIIFLAITIIPIILKAVEDASGTDIFTDISFSFTDFSLIIGIIQVMFTFSSLSLTAISRYGKNAIFFKYIPIEFKTQFKLKNIPELIINTIILVSIIGTIHYLIPEINNIYLLLMFIIAMLLNIINCNILLILDLLRPNLNYENEITVIKQNDNKLFQYILTTVICLILWYLKEVTKELDLNISILIEIIVFSIIVIGMEIFISRKSNKLFKKII